MLLTGLLIPFHFFQYSKKVQIVVLYDFIILYHNFKLRSYQLLFSWGFQDETPNFWYSRIPCLRSLVAPLAITAFSGSPSSPSILCSIRLNEKPGDRENGRGPGG